MGRLKIKAEKRKIFGKKLKRLRKKGILPANLYGEGVKSQALQVDMADFKKIYQQLGETGLLDLALEKGKFWPVLIHNLQVHPVSDEFLHVDFRQVALKEKVKAEIPLIVSGVAPAVSQKKGILIQPLNKLQIEALPTDLPEKIEIDVGNLEKVNDEIKVADLKLDKKITILASKNIVVAKIGPLEEEKAQEKEEAVEEEEKVQEKERTEEKLEKEKSKE